MKAPRKRDEAPPESDVLPDAPPPRRTKHFFGNEAAEQALLDAYKSGRMPHAWLIGGRPGVGKATLAWRVARFLLAHPDPAAPEVQRAVDLSVDAGAPASHLIDALAAPDLALLRREWNTEPNPPRHFTEIRVADVRRALNLFHHNAAGGGWRIAIVDCADDLNRSSANALLKMIEEPPEKSIFLIVAHQPGRLLPTIRSRCRKLMLAPLKERDIVAAISAFDTPLAETPQETIAAAARRADGSVMKALRILARHGAASALKAEELLKRLPSVDWGAVQTLSDDLGRKQAEADYEAFLETVFAWLDAQVREQAGAGPRRLAPYAQVWEKTAAAARAVEIYNLDRRALVLSIFEDLGAAVAAARR